MNIQKWQKELDTFMGVVNCFILEGQINDGQMIYEEDKAQRYSLTDFVTIQFINKGYSLEDVHYFNHITGLTESSFENESKYKSVKINGETGEKIYKLFRTGNDSGNTPKLVILQMASRFKDSAESPSDETRFFTYLEAIVNRTDISYEDSLKDTLVIIVDKVNDLPTWFYIGKENLRILTVEKPNVDERKKMFNEFFVSEKEFLTTGNRDEELEKISRKFVDLTSSFTNNDFFNIHKMYRNDDSIPLQGIEKIISEYQYGDQEDMWQTPDMVKKVEDLKVELNKNVKGQQNAIEKVCQIMQRTVLGLSGLLQSGVSNKPKGVFMFVGPTGVGKTEIVRTLTRHMFGHENKCIRFDMSEFHQEHADQRLFGAPPGYVGYDQGGELTRAVKQNPCSIILFDEIEKANPKIWDKFLQILDDGRLTDSHGETVYFGQTIIAFTSNIGNKQEAAKIYDDLCKQNIEDTKESRILIKEIYAKHVNDYFSDRREVLNRIGDNIVFFDFIDAPTRTAIIESQLNRVKANMRLFQNIALSWSDKFKDHLAVSAFEHRQNGGRGMNTVIEKVMINPMASRLYEYKTSTNKHPSVCDINLDENNRIIFEFKE